MPGGGAALRPPASEADLVAAQEAVGRPLPPDLRAWWLYANGAHSGLQVDGGWLIPPGFVPYPIGEALESRRLWMDGGPRNGCVMEFHRDTGALAQPPRADVADMLDDMAEQLEEGEAELDDSGRIDWP
ncbi:SMI1/KNR4 family protein [Micromonospora zamorensis]|uniref:SMI1/KNR4 family protein n=1 Tax=Micromonospora zamorensis TaxID=709883 RepID=UPI003CFB6759